MQLFAKLQTQWTASFGGITGLNYPAVAVLLDLYATGRSAKRELFEDVQALERGALKAFSEMRKK